ncbi:MAG: hypothetical protein H0T99_10005 [Geodermatophilaceae bacterium]|jgi:hypothetical protein|nr:hypothetical protein [Geodermatophilaceae bacterium]MDQ3475220.1 hypothetical protein [Actinomycetota bacterium]
MSWTWRYEDEAGATLDAPEPEAFESRSDAESWLGENFAELAEDGVVAVTLFEGETRVYGPMSLAAAG